MTTTNKQTKKEKGKEIPSSSQAGKNFSNTRCASLVGTLTVPSMCVPVISSRKEDRHLERVDLGVRQPPSADCKVLGNLNAYFIP